ncbi:hypothetical protein KEM52_002335 [Ascosphaera acerosa]|nr:hypothetical protein KEM52_002335 [Ascosphaera acerosa]
MSENVPPSAAHGSSYDSGNGNGGATVGDDAKHSYAHINGQGAASSPVSSRGLHHAMTAEEHEVAKAAAKFGYGPLAHVSQQGGAFFPAFGGEMQPGLAPVAQIEQRRFANPAPLGLSAFALTTFVLSLINLQTRGVTAPNIVVAGAYAYGGLVQLLAGMWEMAVGNTFGATALSSYGGFWLSYAILLTPGGFEIASNTLSANGKEGFTNAQGFWLIGWFIFTTILCMLTLRSTLAFFSLFFLLDITFLLLAIGHFIQDNGNPTTSIIKTAGVFGILTAFVAWYNAFAGIADDSNSFFIAPVARFPWSAQPKGFVAGSGREKSEKEKV